MALVHERVVAPVGHDRRPRPERLLDVEDRRQLLEVEPDPGDRLEGRLLGLGEDRDDRLALEPDALLGEDELLLGLHSDKRQDRVAVVRDVGGGEGADKARDALRVGQVDPPDPGVVEGAADHLEVEHAGERPVGGVLGPAGDVADGVAPADRPADDVERAHPGRSPVVPIVRAASVDRLDDGPVAGATADVAGQRRLDVVGPGCRVAVEQGLRDHHHARACSSRTGRRWRRRTPAGSGGGPPPGSGSRASSPAVRRRPRPGAGRTASARRRRGPCSSRSRPAGSPPSSR